jgi:ABC-type polysaccharide/polyol phosphate transport system ATPase subunit
VTAQAALELVGVSKSFVVPHHRTSRLKESFVRLFHEKHYEYVHALQDVTLSIPRGEFFGVMGPNGSGKSTLLKVLAAIYRPDRGTVRVNGVVSPFIELGVGFNPELSARDNIYINGTLIGLTRDQIEERFDEIVAFAEVERFVDQQLKNYSNGMIMRLAYSVAVQVTFDILLVDEVLAVGDIEFQQKCFASFERLRREGKTVVFVSHDPQAVQSFCDRALLLDQGVVRHVGDPEEVASLYLHRTDLLLAV